LVDVLGLLYGNTDDNKLDDEIETLIKARQDAREQKNWALADEIRDKLGEMGVILKDTPQGVVIEQK